MTILDFGPADAQVNGIDAIGDDFLVQDLTVKDSLKDGIRVESERRRRVPADPLDVDERLGVRRTAPTASTR